MVDNDFQRLTYTEAVEILKAAKQKFEFPVDWGTDLQSEHERYLVEKHFKKPVILTDYPKDIKAFYMKLNDDGRTVRAMDVLFPGIGEIIGGSQREENLEKLRTRMEQMHVRGARTVVVSGVAQVRNSPPRRLRPGLRAASAVRDGHGEHSGRNSFPPFSEERGVLSLLGLSTSKSGSLYKGCRFFVAGLRAGRCLLPVSAKPVALVGYYKLAKRAV